MKVFFLFTGEKKEHSIIYTHNVPTISYYDIKIIYSYRESVDMGSHPLVIPRVCQFIS